MASSAEWPGVYQSEDGQYYRKKGPYTHTEVVASHSLNKIHDYVWMLPREVVQDAHDATQDVPFESIADFVETMHIACQPGGPFEWPAENRRYNQCLAVALHHLPPGKAVLIKNSKQMPPWLIKEDSPAQGAADMDSETGNREVVHPGESDATASAASTVREQKRLKRETDQQPTPFSKVTPADRPGFQVRYPEHKQYDLVEEAAILYHGKWPLLLPKILVFSEICHHFCTTKQKESFSKKHNP